MNIEIRHTRALDFQEIIELSKNIYREKTAWTERELASHLKVFPEGQFVAVDTRSHAVLGMAASLIVLWEHYEIRENWEDFTNAGMFTNHDPENGRTLYGAEVMVAPDARRRGIGEMLYDVRKQLAIDLNLKRIRAGARLINYHLFADKLSAREYVENVVSGAIKDPTLSFQLGQGFEVIAVVSGYLNGDRESLGKAAIIEWKNPNYQAER